MLEAIARALASAAPATVIGYNTIRFDEEMLRHAFFTHLLPPYATQLYGHRRADLFTMVRAVAMLEPAAITVPLSPAGKPSFKLGAICRANGIALGEDEAHDALADARATLGLFKRLREVAPGPVALMLANAEKGVVNRRLAGSEILLLGGGAQPSPVVGVTAHPTVATSWAVADLTLDPAGYIDADHDAIAKLLTGPGPRPIRLVRSNAQPILLDYGQGCHALPPERRDLALYHERAARIREHAGFKATLAAAMANRYAERAPSPYPESTLYSGGFLSNEDARLSERWHASPWEDRPMIAAQFGDERLKAFANRLMLLEAPHALSAAASQKGQTWLRKRLMTQDDVPWLTLPKALEEVAGLRAGLSADEVARNGLLDAIERWLVQRSQFFQLAA